MTPNRVDVVFFDLGNVILPFNHYQIAEKLLPYSEEEPRWDPATIFFFLFDLREGLVNLYETGKMTSLEFFQVTKDRFRLRISFEAFVPIWNEIFSENREVSEIIRRLRGKKKLGLISNTNALHFNYALTTFPILRFFDKWFLSHEVGFKKPAAEIYRRSIEWAGVEPDHILLIDDSLRNVDGALALGMQAIQFTSAERLKEELDRRLGSSSS